MIQLSRAVLFGALGLALAAGCGNDSESSTLDVEEPPTRRVEVTVNASGYEPSRVEVPAGSEVVLAFRRVTDEGCGQELVIASENIRRPLPLNETVEVTLTPQEAGEVRFTCGMGMYDGAIVVQ
ncbi:MAG: cupredoxin domain-containing protein [Sandaracinaceae bacterium]